MQIVDSLLALAALLGLFFHFLLCGSLFGLCKLAIYLKSVSKNSNDFTLKL